MATGVDTAAAAPELRVIRLSGELDLSTQQSLQVLLAPAVDGTEQVVVIDSTAVTFVDCAGLVPLRRAAAQLQARQAQLSMPRSSAVVRRLAALTGATDALGLVRDSAGHAAPGPGPSSSSAARPAESHTTSDR